MPPEELIFIVYTVKRKHTNVFGYNWYWKEGVLSPLVSIAQTPRTHMKENEICLGYH